MVKKSAVRTKKTMLPVYFGAFAVCLGVLIGLSCLFSMAMCKTDIPRSSLVPVSILISCFAAACGGFTVSTIAGERGVLLGAGLGFVLFILLFLLTLLTGNTEFSALALLRLVLLLIAGAAGGYLGITHHEKSKRLH